MAFLRVSSLTVEPGWGAPGQAPLHDIDLLLDEGSLCTVMGVSGSGKSTLLRTLAGLYRPRRGQIVLDGEDITRRRIGQRRAVLVPSEPVVYPTLTVQENLAFPLRNRRMDNAQISRRVAEMASMLGVLDCMQVLGIDLPVSTAQRVAIGRALIRDDLSLLLLDDAMRVLDAESRRRVLGCLRHVQRSRRMCILVSTQGQADVLGMGDDWVMLEGGRLLQQGRAAEFQQYPQTLTVARRLFGSNLNVLSCRSENGEARFAGSELVPPQPPQLDIWLAEQQAQYPEASIELAIRADNVVLGRPGLEGCIDVLLTRIEDEGTWMKLHAVVPGSEAPLCARVLVDGPLSFELAAQAGGDVAGKPLSLQIINRHSLFFIDGRLAQ